MIEVQSLSAGYGGRPVLQHINATFQQGRVYGILGLNGAGKTTFFQTMAKVLPPISGKILYKGQALSSKMVGYLETSNYFYSHLTGQEYLDIFRQTNVQYDQEALQALFQLPLHHLAEGYSTGMKKKLALLALLKKDRAAYLLDEPFNGLDLEANQALESIIRALREKGKAVLVSSHIVEPLFAVCDEICFLEEGTLKRRFLAEDFHLVKEELLGHLKARVDEAVRGAI